MKKINFKTKLSLIFLGLFILPGFIFAEDTVQVVAPPVNQNQTEPTVETPKEESPQEPTEPIPPKEIKPLLETPKVEPAPIQPPVVEEVKPQPVVYSPVVKKKVVPVKKVIEIPKVEIPQVIAPKVEENLKKLKGINFEIPQRSTTKNLLFDAAVWKFEYLLVAMLFLYFVIFYKTFKNDFKKLIQRLHIGGRFNKERSFDEEPNLQNPRSIGAWHNVDV